MISKASIPLFRKLSLQICSIVHLQPDEKFTPAHSTPTHTHLFHVLLLYCFSRLFYCSWRYRLKR